MSFPLEFVPFLLGVLTGAVPIRNAGINYSTLRLLVPAWLACGAGSAWLAGEWTLPILPLAVAADTAAAVAGTLAALALRSRVRTW